MHILRSQTEKRIRFSICAVFDWLPLGVCWKDSVNAESAPGQYDGHQETVSMLKKQPPMV